MNTQAATTSAAGAPVVNGIRTMLGIAGIVATVVGVLVLFWPARTAAAITAVIGAYALIVGVVHLATAIFSKELGGWARTGRIVLGALAIVAGIVIFANLGAATATLALFVGIFVGIMWIVEGVVSLTKLDRAGAPSLTVVFAVLSIVAGIVMVLSPLWGAVVLWWVAGISLIVLGIMQIVRAFSFGKEAKA